MNKIFQVSIIGLVLAGMGVAPAGAQRREKDRNPGIYGNRDGSVRWSGNVDDTVELFIRARNVRTVTTRGRSATNVNYSFQQSLPGRAERVVVTRESGRGDVRVFQQPNRRNNFTAGIRITDSQGGRGNYRLVARWDR